VRIGRRGGGVGCIFLMLCAVAVAVVVMALLVVAP
jgi:hypothetical protein